MQRTKILQLHPIFQSTVILVGLSSTPAGNNCRNYSIFLVHVCHLKSKFSVGAQHYINLTKKAWWNRCGMLFLSLFSIIFMYVCFLLCFNLYLASVLFISMYLYMQCFFFNMENTPIRVSSREKIQGGGRSGHVENSLIFMMSIISHARGKDG